MRGASAALVSRGGARFLGLAFLVVLAREQSEHTFAAYNYLLGLAAAVGVITDAGVAMVAGREVARGDLPLSAAYRAAAPTQLATSLLAALGVAGLALVANGPGSTHAAIFWTAAFIFGNGLFNLQADLLRGAGRPWVEASLQMSAAVTQVILGVLVVSQGYGLSALMAVLTLKQVLVVAAAQIWLPRPWRSELGRSLWRKFFRQGLWLGGASTFSTLAVRVGPVVLGNVATTAEIGRFAVASRYLETILTLCITAGFGVLPALAQRARAGHAAFQRSLRRIMLYGVAGTAALAVPLVIVVPAFTTAVFGSRYSAAGGPAQLFVAAMPVVAAMYLAWYGLLAQRRERRILSWTVVGLAVAAGGCAWIAVHPTAVAAAETLVAALAVMAIGLAGDVLRGRGGLDPSGSAADVDGEGGRARAEISAARG